MATAKRYSFTLPHPAGSSGRVWTAAPAEGLPAVVVYGGSAGAGVGAGAGADLAAAVATRVARAGFTAVVLEAPGEANDDSGAGLATACDALAHGDLVPGLAPSATLVVLGYGIGVEPARAYAARHGTELLVLWRWVAGAANGVGRIETERIAWGSHVVERSLQPDEALDALLAWLARVM